MEDLMNKRSLLTLGLLTFLCAGYTIASDRTDSALHGTWTLDAEKSFDYGVTNKLFGEDPTEEQLKQTRSVYIDQVSGSKIIYEEGKWKSTVGKSGESEGTWMVKSKDGDKWIIEIQEKGKDLVEDFTYEWVSVTEFKITYETNVVFYKKSNPSLESV